MAASEPGPSDMVLPTIFESVSYSKGYRGPLGLLPFFLSFLSFIKFIEVMLVNKIT